MGPYQSTKLWLVEQVGLSKDALHIYIGLGVFLLVALLFRLPLRDWRPLAAVFAAALLGELLDITERMDEFVVPAWASSWHDLWNTLFWPVMLFLAARWPGFAVRASPPPVKAEEDEVPTDAREERRLSPR